MPIDQQSQTAVTLTSSGRRNHDVCWTAQATKLHQGRLRRIFDARKPCLAVACCCGRALGRCQHGHGSLVQVKGQQDPRNKGKKQASIKRSYLRSSALLLSKLSAENQPEQKTCRNNAECLKRRVLYSSKKLLQKSGPTDGLGCGVVHLMGPAKTVVHNLQSCYMMRKVKWVDDSTSAPTTSRETNELL